MIRKVKARMRIEIPGYPPFEGEIDGLMLTAPTKKELEQKTEAAARIIMEDWPTRKKVH